MEVRKCPQKNNQWVNPESRTERRLTALGLLPTTLDAQAFNGSRKSGTSPQSSASQLGHLGCLPI
jgi:hypothetical protein